MASAKLPLETLTNILDQIDPEGINPGYHSLLQCALVSRWWCTAAVPLMWACPLRLLATYNEVDSGIAQLTTLVACLPADARTAFTACGVDLPEVTTRRPTFAYASFAKELYDYYLYDAVHHWLRKYGAQLDVDKRGKISDDVFTWVAGLFVKERAHVRCLSLTANCGDTRKPTIADALAQISETRQLAVAVEELSVSGVVSAKSLGFFARVCTGVKHLHVVAPCPLNDGLVEIVKANPKVASIKITCDIEDDENSTSVAQIAKIISLTSGNLQQLYAVYGEAADRGHLSLVYKAIMRHCPNLVQLQTYSSELTMPLLPELLEKCQQLEVVVLYDDDMSNVTYTDASDDVDDGVIDDWLPKIAAVMPRRMRHFMLAGNTIADDDVLQDFLDEVTSRVEVAPMSLYFGNIEEFDNILMLYEDQGLIAVAEMVERYNFY